MRRARVVQFIPDLGVGGAERMLQNLVIGLDKERYDVKVLTFFDPKGTSVERDIAASGVEVVSLGKRIGFDPRMLWRTAAALRRLRPDILHTHRPVYPYALPSVMLGWRGRVVHTVHSVADKEVEGRLRKWPHWVAYRAGVIPVAICDFVGRSMPGVYGVEARAVIPNGIPVEAFARPAGSGAAWRAGMGIAGDAVVFASVARLEPAKNTGALVEAFAALGDRPDAVLLLVGDGSQRPALEAKVRALGIGARVCFAGARSDVAEALAASDVFVLSSSFEGHPLSVMEAMAAGKPVVATAVGGVPEIVRSGENGFLVPPGDLPAFTEALRKVLESPELRRRMGESAARKAAESFDLSHMVASYQRLYQEMLDGTPAVHRVAGPAPADAAPERRRRIRVVQLIPNLGLGGAERMLLNLVTNLDRSRFDATILTFFDQTGTSVEKDLARSGIEVVSLGKQLGFDPRMFWRTFTALRRLRPDILHTHRSVFPYALPSALLVLRGRIVHTVHNLADREVEGRLRRLPHWLAYRTGVAPVAICDFVGRSMHGAYGVEPRVVIPNGIPVRTFAHPAGSRGAWRALNGIAEETAVFVSVARFEPQKNTGALLEAFAALGAGPDRLLLLVGDGPLRGALEAQAQALGLGGTVRFTGPRHDIPEVLAASDVFVLPSLFEGHPLSVMEAMAAGRPVVATEVGGVPELIREGETGFLVPPADVPALSGALRRLLEEPALRRRMGQAAALQAAESFDVSHMVAAYQRLYEALLAEVPPPHARAG